MTPPTWPTAPEPGRWFEVNRRSGLGGANGTYDLTLIAGGEERPLKLDGAAAARGWNELGEFSLPGGEVRIEVSDQTSGRLVIADAIRWRLVGEDR